MPLHENLPHNFLPNSTATVDRFTVDASILATGNIILNNNPLSNDHIFVVHNGILLSSGVGEDFTLAMGNVITFACELVLDDSIVVFYRF
jgi:hypothetical protein